VFQISGVYNTMRINPLIRTPCGLPHRLTPCGRIHILERGIGGICYTNTKPDTI